MGDQDYGYEQHKRQFSERLRTLRAKAGLTQMDLARRLCGRTDVSQVSRWERGISFPTFEKLVELAAVFAVDAKWLEWGDDN